MNLLIRIGKFITEVKKASSFLTNPITWDCPFKVYIHCSAILGSTEKKEDEEDNEDAASDTSDLVMRPMDVTNLKTRAFVVNVRYVVLNIFHSLGSFFAHFSHRIFFPHFIIIYFR